MSLPLLRIGTRGSPLALWQARHVAGRLEQTSVGKVELVVLRTTGDRLQDRPFALLGGKGLFTRELEEALQGGAIDLAVHSAKDLPTALPEGLALGAILARDDARDALVAPNGAALAMLPPAARIGTSSLRRAAQLLALRPDLAIVPLRGNVETRLRKLDEGQVDAALLALAGLARLGLAARASEIFAPDRMVPAVGQGALAIETRDRDEVVAAAIAPLHDATTASCVRAERALLHALAGGCQTPIAAHAVLCEGSLRLVARVASLDGRELVAGTIDGSPGEPEALGRTLAAELVGRGADRLLAESRAAQTAPGSA